MSRSRMSHNQNRISSGFSSKRFFQLNWAPRARATASFEFQQRERPFAFAPPPPPPSLLPPPPRPPVPSTSSSVVDLEAAVTASSAAAAAAAAGFTVAKPRMRICFDPETEIPRLQKWFADNNHPSRQQVGGWVALRALSYFWFPHQMDISAVNIQL